MTKRKGFGMFCSFLRPDGPVKPLIWRWPTIALMSLSDRLCKCSCACALGRTARAGLQQARQAKERTHPKFSMVARAQLVISPALEVGGHWSSGAASFIRLPARARARNGLASSCAANISSYTQRWSELLSFAAARFSAASLLSFTLAGTANVE